MLSFLVTSKARRHLLSVLWGEKRSGSVSELASLASVSYASAHTELTEMRGLGLVVASFQNGVEVFAANWQHPEASTLEALVKSARGSDVEMPDDAMTKSKLASLGAPLRDVEPLDVATADRMSVLVRGVLLARRDPTVARVLPVCFWRLRDELDVRKLGDLVSRGEDKHAIGFFLELTGELGGDRRLGGLAESLRDRRVSAIRDFHPSTSRRRVVREFPLAAAWGFRMNADYESFKGLFDKFVRR